MPSRPVALVTGGGRGIGRAISLELAKSGYNIVLTFRADRIAAEKTIEQIHQGGAQGEAVCFDVAEREETEKQIEGLFTRHESVDVLVNNAGETADSLFALMSFEEWRRVLDTALQGFFNVTKPVLKKMISKRKGCIVTLSSVSARLGHRGQTNYAAAKAGLEGASRSLASEVARLGIRVNVVAPGLIATEMLQGLPVEMIKQIIPMGRTGLPEEVAKVVRFLCSDDASYITGQVIAVNGGMI
jgi:3-oxoacyl-[acyl-carrier protein] reductase